MTSVQCSITIVIGYYLAVTASPEIHLALSAASDYTQCELPHKSVIFRTAAVPAVWLKVIQQHETLGYFTIFPFRKPDSMVDHVRVVIHPVLSTFVLCHELGMRVEAREFSLPYSLPDECGHDCASHKKVQSSPRYNFYSTKTTFLPVYHISTRNT